MSTRPQIKAILIDVSGTLHIGSSATKDSVGALQRLRASHLPFKLCSNSSKESTQDLIQRLRRIGFTVNDPTPSEQEVWTSLGSVSRTLCEMGLKSPYLILSESAVQEVLTVTPRSLSSGQESYDSVVVGLAPKQFNYDTLNQAFRILSDEYNKGSTQSGARKPPLIATHKARFIEKDDPPGLSLGPGPFVTALESAAGVQAHVVGKPTAAFYKAVISSFNLPLGNGDPAQGRIAVVGDDIEADLGEGALEMGLWRVLVKTGKYRSGDEKPPGKTPPDEIFDSFADFVDSLLPRPNIITSRL